MNQMSMSAAIIGKDNSPLYISCPSEDVDLQYRIHSALDIIEEKISSQKSDSRELFLGLLYTTEAYKIFGYISNTKIKFLLVVDSSYSSLRENEIRTMFRQLHLLYTDAISNPFYTPNESLDHNKKFDQSVRNICSNSQ